VILSLDKLQTTIKTYIDYSLWNGFKQNYNSNHQKY